jgi:hypothetical protein
LGKEDDKETPMNKYCISELEKLERAARSIGNQKVAFSYSKVSLFDFLLIKEGN